MTAVHSDDLELLERLGGSEASVHRAVVRATGRVVVVKRAPWDRPDVVARLGREAAVLERVEHPSLVRLLATVDDEVGRSLLLGHAPGGSLATRLQRHGPLPPAEVADLGARLAEALAALHRAGVVHRDVHPGNVVVDAELQPVLADLDHALDRHGGHLPSDGEVVGHPDHVDHRLFTGVPAAPTCDLHGLATTLWTVATGTPPPRPGPDQPVELFADHRVPPALRDVVAACLQGDLSAATVATSLHAAAADLRSAPPAVPPPASDDRASGAAAGLELLPPPTATAAATQHPQLAANGDGPPTRRWGPAPGHASLGQPTDRTSGRRPRRYAAVAVLGLVPLALGVWMLIGGLTPAVPGPSAVTGPAAAAAPAAVAPAACEEGGSEPPDGVLADLDGDGCSEVLWLDEGVLHAPAGRFRVGEPGDVLLAGDWDGDGAWGVGLYRPATGHVFLFDGAPGPGLRSRPAVRLPPRSTPVVVSEGTSHRVELAAER